MADKRITGQVDSNEDDDEDEDESDDDEAEHSNDGDLGDLEGNKKDASDKVEDSSDEDEGSDEDHDHIFIGVFNPRHSRGETKFGFGVKRTSGGTQISIVNK
jgi:hypothetical protein